MPLEPRIREARTSDKRHLMNFIKDIWGGHDYIPYVWDEWLTDEAGRMFVVEVDGLPVGMNRVRFLEDGSAWFEGVRVHPEFRGRGLASMLGENSMRLARERGVKVIRLTSASRNKTAHRQIARIGFEEASRISVYEPPKGRKFAAQEGVRLAREDDLSEVGELIRESREFRIGSGVFWDAFSATALTPPVIKKLVDEGSVWKTTHAIMVTRVGGEGTEKWKQVCFLGGDADEAMKLVKHVFALKTRGKTARKLVFLPQGSRLIGALREEGFRRLAPLILFERAAANG